MTSTAFSSESSPINSCETKGVAEAGRLIAVRSPGLLTSVGPSPAGTCEDRILSAGPGSLVRITFRSRRLSF